MADELYRPGYSFENAPVTRIAAPVRTRPWFYQDTTTGPLTAISKKAPFYKDPVFHRYQPVWNRAAKQAVASKIGAYFHDVPSFNELGQAPGPTAITPSISRDPLGFLESMISGGVKIAEKVTTTLQKREEQQTETALARVAPYFQQATAIAGDVWPWILGAGAIGIAVFMFRR